MNQIRKLPCSELTVQKVVRIEIVDQFRNILHGIPAIRIDIWDPTIRDIVPLCDPTKPLIHAL